VRRSHGLSAGGFAVSVWLNTRPPFAANAIGADVLADLIGGDLRNQEARSGGLADLAGTYLDAGSEAVTRYGSALKKSSAIRTLPRLSNPFMIVNLV
jgi:hypothetical protein